MTTKWILMGKRGTFVREPELLRVGLQLMDIDTFKIHHISLIG